MRGKTLELKMLNRLPVMGEHLWYLPSEDDCRAWGLWGCTDPILALVTSFRSERALNLVVYPSGTTADVPVVEARDVRLLEVGETLPPMTLGFCIRPPVATTGWKSGGMTPRDAQDYRKWFNALMESRGIDARYQPTDTTP